MKKIISFLLSVAIIFSFAVFPASATGEDVILKITPDKTTIDTSGSDVEVEYTISIEVKDNSVGISSIGFELLPPAGMTLPDKFKDGSNQLIWYNQSELTKNEMEGTGIFSMAGYTPSTRRFVAGGADASNPLNKNIVLMRIKATVAKGTTGILTLTDNSSVFGTEFGKIDGVNKWSYTVETKPVTVSKAPITSVSATVSQPVKGHPLDTSVNVYDATAYDATVIWKDVEENMTATGNAKPGKIYTALITLKAKEGETFATSLNNTKTPGGYTIQMLNSTELLLTKEFARIPAKDAIGIAIDNTTLTVAVPPAEPNTEQNAELPLTAKVNYDDGTNETVDASWSIVDPKPEGVDIDKDTGKLTVTNKAAGGTVEVKAAYNGMTANATVTITKEPLKPSAIVATAPTTGTDITIPNGGTNTSGNCSYKVYDQYGAEKTGISATWKMEPATVPGVTFVSANGSFFVNNTATTCTVKLYAEGSGLKSNEITFHIDRATSVANSLTIEGSTDSVTVPTVSEPGTTKCEYAAYTAKVLDQYGAEMTGKTIEWSVTGNPGVTINNGQLIVTNKATGDNVTITAKYGTLTATKTVTINKDEAKVSIVKITAQDNEPPVTIITCTGSQRSESYTATVYDQYGNEKQDDVNWSLDPISYSGVSYEISETNDNIVTLKVAPDTAEGTFKLVATSKTITTVKGELEIKVQKKTDVSDKINFANGSLTYNGKGQKHENAALDSSVTPGTGDHWAYTYTVKGSTASLDGGLPKTVGTYNVTATYEDSLNVGSKTVELTIGPKEVTVSSGITAESKKYDGDTSATVDASGATFIGKVDGDELTVSVTSDSTFDSADVGSRTVTLGTLTLGGTSAGNYTLATNGNQTTTTADITRRDLTVTPEPNQSKKFGAEDPTMLSFATANVVPKQTTSFTGKLSRAEGEAVGQYDITLGTLEMTDNSSGFKASNYTLQMVSPTVKFEITKADAPTLPDITVSQKYTVTTEQSKDIGRAGMPEKAGTLAYAKGTESKTGSVKVDSWSVDSTTGKVSYKLSNGAADDTVTLPVTIKSTNYADATVRVVITLTKPSYSDGGSYTPSYTVSVDKTENGTITVSPKSASKGDTVTITVKPDKGYELDTLKVLDKDGDKVKLTEKNGKYTFKMPSGKVTVKGSFVEEAPVQIFKDVPTDAYYYEAVKWAAEKGITGGVGNKLFAPNQPCTRAQIVTFLWRAAGSPAPKSMSSFADVPADAFYAKAVAWAVENGITGGTGDGKFSPDATCTRAQAVTFLYRAAGSPKVSGSAEFGDVATNAYYADAVAWAAKNGITGGIGGGLFGSNNDCTRAQIVTFLYRCVK